MPSFVDTFDVDNFGSRYSLYAGVDRESFVVDHGLLGTPDLLAGWVDPTDRLGSFAFAYVEMVYDNFQKPGALKLGFVDSAELTTVGLWADMSWTAVDTGDGIAFSSFSSQISVGFPRPGHVSTYSFFYTSAAHILVHSTPARIRLTVDSSGMASLLFGASARQPFSSDAFYALDLGHYADLGEAVDGGPPTVPLSMLADWHPMAHVTSSSGGSLRQWRYGIELGGAPAPGEVQAHAAPGGIVPGVRPIGGNPPGHGTIAG